MRIAIVSKSAAAGGGASRVAEELAGWLILAGHTVDHYCAQPPAQPRNFQLPLYGDNLVGRLGQEIHRRARQYRFNEVIPVEYFTRLGKVLANYDAVHFHDHYSAYSMLSVGWLSRHTRVFFTAHDCLHFTGSYSYVTPNPDGHEKESLRAIFSRSVNQYVAQHYPATYVYPSRWLLGEARRRLNFAKEPVVLPNGFDPAPYEYKSRCEARRALGLPERQPIICVSAHFLSEPRKGTEFALRAVAAAADLDPLVIFVGNPVSGVERMIPGVKFWFAGYVESRSRLGLLFAAADVFLFCPLQDNLPISVQEAMGAATPVVGFATGGVVEMVEDGRSAWLVPTGDQVRLDAALRDALTSNAVEERGEAARSDLSKKFSVTQCVQAHESLYRGHAVGAPDPEKIAAEMACGCRSAT